MSNYSDRTTEDLQRLAVTLKGIIKTSEERYDNANSRLDSLRKWLLQDMDAYTEVEAELLTRSIDGHA